MEREKVIQYMRKAVACHNENPADCLGRNCCDCPHDYPMDSIELIESALELLEQDRWIPVTERLPEKDDFVLVTISGVTSNSKPWEHTMTLAVWTGDSWDLVDADMADFRIFAWRPLPAPYQEEDNE